MASVQPIRVPISVERADTVDGVAAKHLATAFSDVDLWDVFLAVGSVMLFTGLWLCIGLGVALATGGGLLIVGGLMGARGKQMADVTDTPATVEG